MIDFLFMESETEELFIVQESSLEAAMETAREYFDEPIFIRELTEEEAEDLGYDTYQGCQAHFRRQKKIEKIFKKPLTNEGFCVIITLSRGDET